MLLTKTQLLAAQFASEDESRRALGMLLVEPAGVVWATNGHYLVKVSAIGPLPEEDFPVVAPADSLPVSKPILIPRALALAVARAIPKRSNLPVLGYAQLRALPAGRAVLAVTDFEVPQLWYIELQNVTFPNVEAIMPFTPKLLESPIGFSAKHLAEVAGYAQKTTGNGRDRNGRGVVIRWEFIAPNYAARFSWKTEAGEEIDGRLMPMTLTDAA